MSQMSLHPGFGPTRAQFEQPGVQQAVKPRSHRPIPNNNLNWKPQAFRNAMARGERHYDIKAQDIQLDLGTADAPSNAMVHLNNIVSPDGRTKFAQVMT
ncbi:hypothetical protein N7468_010691 [Penicillium chermesinum]|uniref:Uncharacterized protein n=1 Tax=Penicillium chermesinum TaxID=63820 RepID=A0A9W9T9Y6_9EURO|nr:uncharacterized protein N7468_010691 [Penicillium chermesinum]KAJ5215012.1 hypothetical protein N7468_010691 [Penicillium chermesinum]KAJ6141488.1 hypothetical protein N7470_009878 [Penicillium chermesinum]